jgi:hypothetical protein
VNTGYLAAGDEELAGSASVSLRLDQLPTTAGAFSVKMCLVPVLARIPLRRRRGTSR